jgi:capsid protein
MGLLKILGEKLISLERPAVVAMADERVRHLRPESSGAIYRTMFTHTFNGEKNLGEIGPIKEYALDYASLRARSWQSYLESEITQMVFTRLLVWLVGDGLKAQAEPSKIVLSSEKIEIGQDFNESVEAWFRLFCKSKTADYASMRSFNHLQKRIKKNAIIGGDVLVVLRVVNGRPKVQLIDGAHVQSPRGGTDFFPEVLANGNMIKYGVEVDPAGKHVAFHVRQANYTVTRIPAISESSGLQMAYLVYGLEYRLDGVRGMPLIAAILETIAKLDRYKEAAVGSAEERQKIAYFFEHESYSTGENPTLKNAARAAGFGPNGDELPVDIMGNQLADRVTATTNKQTFNLPLGAKIKSLEGKSEMFYKEFYTTNIDIVCACVNIPPNVALSKYDSNFSASRAALKDWEHTLRVDRADFAEQATQPVYNLFLDLMVLLNKVQAPGYLAARQSGDTYVLEAYRSCRWVGPSVPHIDPVKEVTAERLKLGKRAENVPLTTVEAATERLDGGDADENMEQFAAELEAAEGYGIDLDTVENVREEKEGLD